jgi:hypothetical protein
MEWYDYVNWGVVVSSAVFGWLAGWNYSRQRYCRHCLGGLLFVLRKLHERGAYLAPYDIAIIKVAIDFYNAGERKEVKK